MRFRFRMLPFLEPFLGVEKNLNRALLGPLRGQNKNSWQASPTFPLGSPPGGGTGYLAPMAFIDVVLIWSFHANSTRILATAFDPSLSLLALRKQIESFEVCCTQSGKPCEYAWNTVGYSKPSAVRSSPRVWVNGSVHKITNSRQFILISSSLYQDVGKTLLVTCRPAAGIEKYEQVVKYRPY